MSKNYIQKGDILALVVPSGGVVGGTAYLIGSLFVVALVDNATVGDTFEGVAVGIHELPKASGAITQGALLYWDNTAKNLTTTATSNKLVGHAVSAAQSGDTTAFLRIAQPLA